MDLENIKLKMNVASITSLVLKQQVFMLNDKVGCHFKLLKQVFYDLPTPWLRFG